MNVFERARNLLGSTAAARYALLPLRLIVGYGFLAHGMAKLHKGADAFAATLQATGVPAPHFVALLTIATELVTGVLVLLGAFVALASIPMIILLVVAILTVHLPYGFTSIKLLGFMNGRAQFGPVGYECNLLYIAAILALALSGPSPLSVDELLVQRRRLPHPVS